MLKRTKYQRKHESVKTKMYFTKDQTLAKFKRKFLFSFFQTIDKVIPYLFCKQKQNVFTFKSVFLQSESHQKRDEFSFKPLLVYLESKQNQNDFIFLFLFFKIFYFLNRCIFKINLILNSIIKIQKGFMSTKSNQIIIIFCAIGIIFRFSSYCFTSVGQCEV